MLDQLEFCSPYTSSISTNNVSLLDSMTPLYQKVGVGLLKDSSFREVISLTNPPSTQTASMNVISSRSYDTLDKEK